MPGAGQRPGGFEERVLIARELHDVVAHHVSMMGVQAGAARVVIGRDPVRAKEALASIERSSRQPVLELHCCWASCARRAIPTLWPRSRASLRGAPARIREFTVHDYMKR